MKSICNAVNVLKPEHPEELHHKPLRASITVEDDSQYGEQNRVKKYLPANAPVGDTKKQIDRILDLPNRGQDAPPQSTGAVKDDIPF